MSGIWGRFGLWLLGRRADGQDEGHACADIQLTLDHQPEPSRAVENQF